MGWIRGRVMGGPHRPDLRKQWGDQRGWRGSPVAVAQSAAPELAVPLMRVVAWAGLVAQPGINIVPFFNIQL
jgi:hypothetical protein